MTQHLGAISCFRVMAYSFSCDSRLFLRPRSDASWSGSDDPQEAHSGVARMQARVVVEEGPTRGLPCPQDWLESYGTALAMTSEARE